MISFLIGTVIEKSKDALTIMTMGGVGYEVRLTPLKLGEYTLNQKVSLYTYLKVAENAFDLYGFANQAERIFFTLLMTVSGIGPKSAMNILSLGSIDEIQSAIAREDVKYLTAVQGMGKKTAERLVVELKAKVKEQGTKNREQLDSSLLGDVVEGLVSIGYSVEEVRNVVQELDIAGKTSEEILKEALKLLSK